MKKIFVLLLFAVLASTATNAEAAADVSTLFNTKWKLKGFFSVETNEFAKPNAGLFVTDSVQGDAYTLEFSQDSAISHEGREYRKCAGRLADSRFWGLYAADYANSTINFEVLVRPNTKSESGDGEKYDRALYLSRAFELKDAGLKIYYGGKGDYLLFGSLGQLETSGGGGVMSRAKGAGTADNAPAIVLAGGGVTAGPNPVEKASGLVNFYRMGTRVKSASLKIYDASGKAIGRLNIRDGAVPVDVRGQHRRQVGSWNLKDAYGRPVSEGTYLVKGTIKTVNGKPESVSLPVSIR
jgi:hypothetical protein